jgi:hypothetical protein
MHRDFSCAFYNVDRKGVFVLTKKIIVSLMALVMFMSSVLTYPLQALAQKQAYAEDFYSNPDNLLSLLPPTNTHDPVGNPAQGIMPQLPSTSPESVDSHVSPRREAALLPPQNQTPEPSVNEESGYLELSETDIFIPEDLLSFGIKREYRSNNENVGAFGKGWDTKLDSKLQMYAEYAIGEFRLDGTTLNYTFVKDDPDAFVTSYDGDDKTNYELHKGHYQEGETGDTLTRKSQYEYIVETKDGRKITYYGYFAPWRSGQDAKVGKIVSETDRYGNTLIYSSAMKSKFY